MAFGQLSIDEMFAFVVVDDDGTEGVVGIPGPSGGLTPMVGADMARVDQLMPIAEKMARKYGKTVEVIKFSQRTSVRTIQPDGAPREAPRLGAPREAPRLGEQVERVAPQHFREEVQMFDKPVATQAAQMHGVVVAPAIADGTPAVGLIFLDEQNHELPAIVVVGPTAKDIGPLCVDAYQKAKQAIG